jgi:hypothetical protein
MCSLDDGLDEREVKRMAPTLGKRGEIIRKGIKGYIFI